MFFKNIFVMKDKKSLCSCKNDVLLLKFDILGLFVLGIKYLRVFVLSS